MKHNIFIVPRFNKGKYYYVYYKFVSKESTLSEETSKNNVNDI